MDQKDRFGEQLHNKERADENRFAAEQDRKALEKMRAANIAVARGLCPRCGVALATENRDEVTVDTCPQCGGHWLDRGELAGLAERKGEAAVTTWLRSFLPR